jgi:MipA family protein
MTPFSCRAAAFIGFLSLPLASFAEQRPVWEAGMGLSAFRLPVYRGSDEFRNLVLPAPYFVYRGERLKVDREGGRGLIWKSETLELDVSFGGSLPVSSKSNVARSGMPSLKGTIEVGPLLIASLWKSDDKNTALTARVPFRAVLASNFDGAGYIFQPQLAFDVRNFAASGWTVGARGGPVFQSADYANYYYGVGMPFVTPNRAEYSPKGGYGGYNVLVGGSKRYANVWVGAFVKYDNLASASFADSPLVKKQSYVSAGLVVSWVFGQSSQRVESDD